MRLLIKAVDWVAILVLVLAITVLLPVLVFQGIVGVLAPWFWMFGHPMDRILLIIVGVPIAWCALRWKELNKRG